MAESPNQPGRGGFRNRVSDTRGARAGELRSSWNRLPPAARNWIPILVPLALIALYPTYVSSLPTDLPVILRFPDVSTWVVMLVFMTMGLGLNIVVGYAGLLDLGYVAFYAVGAYTAGWLASGHFQQVRFHFGSVGISEDLQGIHVSIWLVLLVAGLVTGIAGIIIGLPTLRLRGDYLAIVTLGFGEIIPQVVRNGNDLKGFNLTNGSFGINPIDSPGFGEAANDTLGLPLSFQQSFDKQNLFFWSALAILVITVFVSMRLRDSRLGRAWIAIREDETAAAAMGIPLMRTKTWSYALGAFFGGVAGAFFASFKSGAFPSEFFFNISVFILCMVVLGGMGSIVGVLLASAILAWLNVEGLANIGTWLKSDTPLDFEVAKYQFGIYGVIIVIMMLFRPEGLIPERRHKRELAAEKQGDAEDLYDSKEEDEPAGGAKA
jgi:branched-chain amino acid transport system permease protein